MDSKYSNKVELNIPIRTVSEANTREHWHKSAKRHNQQKFLVKTIFQKHVKYIHLPCKIRITRISPRFLDSRDNLPMSLKWIVDQICDSLVPGKRPGMADSDERIDISYDQKKGAPNEYAVKIEITF